MPKAAGALMRKIAAVLRAEVGVAAAGYFLRSRAFQPNSRPHLNLIANGAAILSMWYRKDRLQELTLRLEAQPPTFTILTARRPPTFTISTAQRPQPPKRRRR